MGSEQVGRCVWEASWAHFSSKSPSTQETYYRGRWWILASGMPPSLKSRAYFQNHWATTWSDTILWDYRRPVLVHSLGSFSVPSSWIHWSVQPCVQGQLLLPLSHPGLRNLGILYGSLISAFAAFSLCFPIIHKPGASHSFQCAGIPKVLLPQTPRPAQRASSSLFSG